jgi:hypothetical protein
VVVDRFWYPEQPIDGLTLTIKGGKIIAMQAKSGPLEQFKRDYEGWGGAKDAVGVVNIGTKSQPPATGREQGQRHARLGDGEHHGRRHQLGRGFRRELVELHRLRPCGDGDRRRKDPGRQGTAQGPCRLSRDPLAAPASGPLSTPMAGAVTRPRFRVTQGRKTPWQS